MSHIYITDRGAVLGVKGGRYEIRKKEELLKSVPMNTVEAVTIFGNSAVSTQAVQQLLEDGIPVNFFSGKGKYYGSLQSMNTMRRVSNMMHRQFLRFDDPFFCRELARKMISAKIHNQRVLLLRLCHDRSNRSRYEQQINQMTDAERHLTTAEDTAQIMGYEGIAAKSYYRVLGQIVDEDFRFSRRTRRPPEDPFNALLSLGYTLLVHESIAALQSAGLDPYYGVLHTERKGGASLAFDMIEEWRTPVVDAMAASIVDLHELSLDDFREDARGHAIYLNREGLRKFLKKYERKMNTKTKYLSAEKEGNTDAVTYREAMFHQCKALAQCIKKQDTEIYIPFRYR